jgi:hypothetical protein
VVEVRDFSGDLGGESGICLELLRRGRGTAPVGSRYHVTGAETTGSEDLSMCLVSWKARETVNVYNLTHSRACNSD